jgi:hypothetical protein
LLGKGRKDMTAVTDIISRMRPKDTIIQPRVAKAIDFLEKAKNVLNGHFPDVEVAINDALERLYNDGDGGE